MIQYLIKSSVYLAVFYIIYVLLISKDTHYRRNRIYLLSSIIISLLLPLVTINSVPGGLFSSLNQNMSSIVNIPQVNIYAINQSAVSNQSISLLWIYLAGCMITFLILMFNLLRLTSYIRKYRVEGSRIVLTPPGRESGFSAMGYVFLNKELKDEIKNTILVHEQQHIRNKHFFDIILLRFTGVLFWFNPFIYLYELSLKALHEFEADQQMLDSGRNVVSYQRLLLNQVFNTNIFTLQNGFSGRSLIKKRMIMMTKKRSKKMSGLKLFAAVPVILFVFIVFSCKNNESVPLDIIDESSTTEQVSDQADESKSYDTLQDVQEEKAVFTDVEGKSSKTPQEVWDDKPVFTVVEEMPTFQGGDVNVFRNWVQKNVKYPEEAAREGIQGKVFVMFLVDNEGSVQDVTILRGVDPSLDAEVIRVVESSPVWVPGKQKGVVVPVKYSITVNFQLQ